MRKVVLYIATSLDGFIARPNGWVDWLENHRNPDQLDYGYRAFYDSIDTVLMGSNTYRDIQKMDIAFPYSTKENFVYSRRAASDKDEHVHFVKKDVNGHVKRLKKIKGKDIWLVGGGRINGYFLKEGLIDEMIISTFPIVLNEGIRLFEGAQGDHQFELESATTFNTGIVQLKYLKKGDQ